MVVCKLSGDNLLCSNKNCFFLLIFKLKATLNDGELQIVNHL